MIEYRLNAVLKDTRKSLARGVVDAILADLDTFTTGAPAFDGQNPDRNQSAMIEYRLNAVLKDTCKSLARGVVDAILADLDTFTAGPPDFDGQTLIAIKVQ